MESHAMNGSIYEEEGRFMKWLARGLFCTIAACFLIGCASTSDKEAKVATQATPPPAQVAQGGTPVADLPEMGFNFGTVGADSNLTHEFKVKNAGDGVLLIKKVLPG
jgi:hypothetical protein